MQLGTGDVAFPELIGDFVESAPLPLLGLRQPENATVGIQRGAFPAQGFLTANFHQSSHALHSCGVKPIPWN